ncbi:ATP-binding protein [Micromonospora sp. WMMD1120]|uniref:ATP-binding protein n=1 Tax=Micromonospora sp. WMMD1120 TaxID=3016106 RepID=UPI0024175C09|nr:ATP-binding protein [Micromonospora sp. WMMD1120]MDG4806039.1 ATP-binding protein [Micromonospora sp. WMMD1120]
MARCLLETDESSGALRLTGVLDASAAPAVRGALLARLGDRPGPVVADVTGLQVVDGAGWDVFAEVRREVADWPAADLLLCDRAVAAPQQGDPTAVVPQRGDPTAVAVEGPDAASTGGSTPPVVVAGVPVWPTVDDALAAVATTPLAAVLTAELSPTVTAARQARELVSAGCERWGMPALVDPATIAVTEMVNNVVAHARTPMTVRLAPRDSTLHLAVRDHSAQQPTFAGMSPPTRAGGRGLLLIDSVTRRWGSTALPDGKVVWCVLHPDDEVAALG